MIEGIVGLGVFVIFLLWAAISRITKSEFISWGCFAGGFALSVPMALMFLWAPNVSNSDNTLWLGIMAVLFFLTLPGSLILLVVGGIAVFGGKTGELIAGVCALLSVANAHLVGMIYYGGFQKRNPNVDSTPP